MKIQEISDAALKSMANSYSESGKEIFVIDYFRQLFPNEADEHISNALYALQSDGFVKVGPGDGIAYSVSLTSIGKPN